MAEATQEVNTINVEQLVRNVLQTIDREREREIIARRFGLFDRKETLEQIGELLSITRERVRQLEKSVVTKLKTNAHKELAELKVAERVIGDHLQALGSVARISDLSARLTDKNSKIDQSRVAFLYELIPNLSVVDDNDHFHHAVGLKGVHDEKAIRDQVGEIIDTIKKEGIPAPIEKVATVVKHNDPKHTAALASISKQLATLNGQWGLAKWPLVNPKNIRDKIYVILKENGTHLHFNDIAKSIKDSTFKRKDVTTQAIHNELIKDSRFVLVGRGMYALKEWGYKKGTVADIITEVLKKENGPLHRDEIVKRVLKHRFVKETTILLNLQGKSQFKRVAKATYTLA